MSEQTQRYRDGPGYDRGIGEWSRLMGKVFLEWLAPDRGWRWIDIGCGTGAFTQQVIDLAAPSQIDGIDPSEQQLAIARKRVYTASVTFHQCNASALPFAEDNFDAAVMALVLPFVPEPAKGVAEMVRVVAPGGVVAAYMWDQLREGGFPSEPIVAELRGMGVNHPAPPSVGATRMEMLPELWINAGLHAVETREISVERTFADFDEFWTLSTGSNIGQTISAMADGEPKRLKERVRSRLEADTAGRITFSSRANAIKGRVPR